MMSYFYSLEPNTCLAILHPLLHSSDLSSKPTQETHRRVDTYLARRAKLNKYSAGFLLTFLTAEQCSCRTIRRVCSRSLQMQMWRKRKGQQKLLHSEFCTLKLRFAIPDSVSLLLSVFSWSYPPKLNNDSSISSNSVVGTVSEGFLISFCTALSSSLLLYLCLSLASKSKMDMKHQQKSSDFSWFWSLLVFFDARFATNSATLASESCTFFWSKTR